MLSHKWNGDVCIVCGITKTESGSYKYPVLTSKRKGCIPLVPLGKIYSRERVEKYVLMLLAGGRLPDSNLVPFAKTAIDLVDNEYKKSNP